MDFQTYIIPGISLEYYIQQVPGHRILYALDFISWTGYQTSYIPLGIDDQSQHK